MMEESTFGLLTELCSELAGDVICSHPSVKKKIITKLRAKAYEIVLSNRRIPETEDDFENNPTDLLLNILGHVYSKAKAKGQWSKDMMEDVNGVIDRAEVLTECNSSSKSVLKFLWSLADNASPSESLHHQEPSYGLDMKILITDHSLKHKSLIKSRPKFDSDIFELPVRTEKIESLQVRYEHLGTGLKHKQFFYPTLPLTRKFETSKFEEDVNNGNWINSKLSNMCAPVRSTITDPRASMHPDEGYVTPDHDLVQNQEFPYIPWEDMYKEDLKFVYSWGSFGSAVTTKEPSFIFYRRDAMDPIGRVIHASNATSSHGTKSDLTSLRVISVEELEVAFKNLLVGVESSIFQYKSDIKTFVLQKGLCLKGSTASTLEEYCEDFIECGNRFRQLSKMSRFSRRHGLIFQALCNNIRQYLQCFRGIVLKMPAMQCLLGARNWLYKLSTQMQFLISFCSFNSTGKSKDLLINLCDKIPVLNRHDLSFLYYYILQSCCAVYFTFLSKWVFEGVADIMWQKEFCIKCNHLTEDMYNRKFWSEGFILDQESVPSFLKGLESKLLLCGKSMALLKLCAADDPICKEAKKEHPEIICCFNKGDLEKIEGRFEAYKERCKTHCLALFGNTTPEPHSEDYYAGLRAKTLNEIRERQEEERRLKAEKKMFEFNVLKKDMEDAKARKMEEKIILLKEEEKLMEEAEKIDQFNDLRREEEREKMVQFYSSLSEAADRRRYRAEWKIKRAELYDKRCAFLNEDKVWLEENMVVKNKRSHQNEKTKLLSAEKSLEKYLETYSSIPPGSGDYIAQTSVSEESLLDASESSVVKEEPLKQLLHGEEGDVIASLKSDRPKLEYSIGSQAAVNDDKRDWLIALDVAEQARQSALIFKQRNMHNDYNIITGEESTYKSKFGKIHTQETKDESVPCDITDTLQKDDSSDYDKVNSGPQGSDVSITLVSNSCQKEKSEDEVEGVDGQYSSDKPLISPTDSPKKLVSEHEKSISAFNFILNMSFSSTRSESETIIHEIDMTSIHQNIKKSVMMPLLTQLELTDDAILRLFNKHNLLKHVECIWKYFYLLEGEFARNLTKNLFQEAQKVQHPSYLLNVMKLNSLLRCAVGTNIDEEFTERLSFYVKEIPSVFRSLDPGMLDCLSIRYKTHWPINVIITDELIAKQDVIFKHLLKLHRMSWALEEAVYLLKDKRLSGSEEYRIVQLFRHVMTHFTTTVRQNITAVAIEQTWCEFKEKFQNATTVDMMYELYRSYVKIVNARCLLGKARIHVEQFLNNLFKQVLVFYEALRSGEWILDTATKCYQHSNFSRLNHAFDNFKKIADHLMYLFKKMSTNFPYMEQLTTMLSQNDFYIIKGREHNL